MKNIKRIVLSFSLIVLTSITMGQKEATDAKLRSPKWVSEKGYWVIEGNIHTPKSSIVRFYANNRQLIYTEKVEGVILNVKKRRTLMKLKRALDKIMAGWEKDGIVIGQGELLANLSK